MKVNVLLSCDKNPYYFDFWEKTRDIWEKRIGIHPKLVYINSDRETQEFDKDNILHVKQVDSYPVHLQAQLARLYFSQKFQDEICLVSDIDMFPVSREFFDINQIIANCDKQTFFHLNPERREFGQLPICYYCGYGSLYEKLFDGMTWSEFLNFIVQKDFNTDKFNFKLPPHLASKKLWFSDEIFMFTSIQDHGFKIRINNKTIMPGERLDREQIQTADLLSILNGRVIDIHLPRPYSDHKRDIDRIIDTLMI